MAYVVKGQFASRVHLMKAYNVDLQMQLLRAQLSQQALDKDKLVSLLERCQEELDGSVRHVLYCYCGLGFSIYSEL